jgi:protein translocase SecG subunit
MDKAILVIHVLVAVVLVGLILIQRSNTDGGAVFGGGSQNSLLGTSGTAPLLTKITVGLVTIFFVTSMVLAYYNRHFNDDGRILIPALETVSDRDALRALDDEDVPQVTVKDISEIEDSNLDDDLPR